MASFQERKNGRITVKVRRHGIAVSETFTSRTDAEAWARKTESEIERGLWRDTSESERTTIADLCTEYKKRVLPMLHGHSAGPALRAIESKLGKTMLAKLTTRMVADYRDQRLRAVSAETVRKEMGTLSKMIDLAGREWGIQIPSNPVKQVSKPAPGRPRDRRLHEGEETRLFASLAKCKSHYMLPLVKLALETAARQGELLSMRWSHVNKARRFVMLYDTKNGEDRAQPLSTEALAILESLPRHLKDGRVFPVTQSLVAQAWGHAVRRAGIENLHFHDLRHETLSRLAERGDMSVLELAAVSGHKTLQMLKRYTHLQAEKLAHKIG